jgi:hypothetical protein
MKQAPQNLHCLGTTKRGATREIDWMNETHRS